MNERSSLQPAIFLDRDGTLNEDVDYLASVEELRVFEHASEAVGLLKEQGFLVVVITNQSGVGRGFIQEDAVDQVHEAIQQAVGGAIDAFYFCPHLPEDRCRCRKPATAMIERAANDLNIDVANSWMVGDKKIDVETGFNAGAATALVLTGYGAEHVGYLDRMPDVVADNLLEAAKMICQHDGSRSIRG